MARARARWRFSDGVAIALLVSLAVVASWDVWSEIAMVGLRDPENSHILLAGPVVVLLAFLRRARLRQLNPSHGYAGVVIVALSAVMIEVGRLNAWDVFEHLGALGMVVGAVTTVLGLPLVLQFKPSLLAMLFFLPVPERIRQEIALPLQEYSARIVAFCLDIFAVPVERSGNALAVNGYEVAIAEACNGMRMVSALAIVTLAFVFSVPMRREVRILFLLATPVIALLVNVIRLIPTVLMYGYANEDTAETFHDLSGWGVLAIAIALLYGLFGLLRWMEIPVQPYPVRLS